MAFGATPQDGSSTPIPMSSAVPDGTNTPLAIEGGPSIATGGNTLVPVSMYVKDGNNIALGVSTDAANANSVIGQLKQIKSNTTLGQTTGIVQSTNNKSSGSVASLAKAFTTNNVAGNSIIVVCAVGNGTAPTISDTLTNSYTQAAPVANGTAFNVAVFFAVGIAAGANTVTVNNGGTTASIAMEIYEVSGLLAQKAAQPDIIATNTGSSATAATAAISASSPNELAFAGIGVGTAAQTITAGAGWTNDSGQQNPTTPAGLFSFISMSQFLEDTGAVLPQATFTSEPWAIAVATFTPVLLGVNGTVKLTDGTVTLAFGQNTMANSLPVTLANNQPNQNVTVSTALPAGAATIGAVTQAIGPWTANMTQVGSTNIVTGGVAGLLAVGGPVASGVANADNPVKIGAVFNTTQPTVTNGQVVDIQATARGAKIVATGADTFHVTVDNGNLNGQSLMVNSAPVVLASDQTAVSMNMAKIGGLTLQAAAGDGIAPNVLPAQTYLYNGGGPPLANGVSSQFMLGRAKSLQNAAIGATINSTTSGNTSLTFPSPPLTIIPGSALKLHTTGFAAQEWVYVASSYVPTASSTVVPLVSPVVNTGCIGALWEQFDDSGPRNNALLTNGVGISASAIYDASSGNYYVFGTLTNDGVGANTLLGSTSSLFNGTNVDRARNNLDVALLASAAHTTTQTSADQTNYNGRGIKVTLDVTTAGTGSITLTINYKDPASGKYRLLLSGAAVTTIVTNTYTVYPGMAVAANVSASDILPRTFQIVVTAGNANSMTYSVGYSIML